MQRNTKILKLKNRKAPAFNLNRTHEHYFVSEKHINNRFLQTHINISNSVERTCTYCTDKDFMAVAEELVQSGVNNWNSADIDGVVGAYAEDGMLIPNGMRSLEKHGMVVNTDVCRVMRVISLGIMLYAGACLQYSGE